MLDHTELGKQEAGLRAESRPHASSRAVGCEAGAPRLVDISSSGPTREGIHRITVRLAWEQVPPRPRAEEIHSLAALRRPHRQRSFGRSIHEAGPQ